ncbi:hypothetical protein ACN261_29485 [Micromonospora sp. WMMD723]|uniref:hypothetical protein n=1 Tax=unclassified Micromonospora TaxID=2617518 RepID=UPI001198B2CC|nr:hypothetical protein [Micromonospora sp. HM134]QDY09454.1 hypothetical protein FJK98_21805 [Micromonospora sp. HM134]
MDPTRSMLLALAKRAEETRLDWQAGRAAVRARGETPHRNEAFAHHIQANLCLLTAITAADLPATFRIHDTTLSTDPITAAQQLRDLAPPYDRHGPIEATHEAARQAYREAFAEPITAQEQQYIDLLAALTPARRDKVIAAAEERASHPRP